MRLPLVGAILLAFSLACSTGPLKDEEATEDPRPTHSVTVYSEGLELFMEYPSFVVGQESALIAHFTDANKPEGFHWVTTGTVTATLEYANQTKETFSVDHLLRNGIFKPVVRPTKAGEATLVLHLEGPISGTVSAGKVSVYPSVEAAIAAEAPEEAGEPTVPYLKESQWATVYATAPAELRQLRGNVPAPAEITAPAGQMVEIAAPFSGRIDAANSPSVGQKVSLGEGLGSIVPIGGEDRGASDVGLVKAEADLDLTEKAVERARRLYPGSISKRELDVAESDLLVAKKTLDAARRRQGGWQAKGGGGFELRSPISGVIAYSNIIPGRVVEEGTPLLMVVNPQRLWAVAQVFEMDAMSVVATSGMSLELPSRTTPLVLDAASGAEVVAVGAAIDPKTRTVPVIVAFDNPGDLMPGMFAQAQVFTSSVHEAVAIPKTAVVDDGGLATVFVMEGGESFFKRRVVLGDQDGLWVEVISGVSADERVVSRGAWEVKLATMPGAIPAHGHQH